MRRSQRDLETEKNALIFREKNAIKSLRERAKAHSPEELRPLAMEIARIRGGIANVEKMQRLLDGLAAKVLNANTSAAVATIPAFKVGAEPAQRRLV